LLKKIFSQIGLWFILGSLAAWAQFGSAYITSTPAGANVYFRGTLVGTTPTLLDSLPVGTHQVRLSMAGYRDAYATLDIKPDLTSQVSLSLVKIVKPAPRPVTTTVKPVLTTTTIKLTTTKLTTTSVKPQVPKPVKPVITPKPTSKPTPKPTVGRTPAPVPSSRMQSSILTITTQPSGAQITFNGNYLGVSPLLKKAVNSARGDMVISLEGYKDYRGDLLLKPGESYKFAFELEKENITIPQPSPTVQPVETPQPTATPQPMESQAVAGNFEVDSNPPGAKIFINGKARIDTTPHTYQLTPGKYRVKIVKTGYGPQERRVEINSENPVKIKFDLVNIAKGIGGLYIESTPDGAEILLNEKSYGKAPKLIEKISPGEYALKLSLNDYFPYTGMVTVVKGKTLPLKPFVLKPVFSTLLLTSTPPGALVYLNDQLQENIKTPVSLKLTPGEYFISLSLDGYKPDDRNITLKQGEDFEVSSNLVQVGPDYSVIIFLAVIGLAGIMVFIALLKKRKTHLPQIELQFSTSKRSLNQVAPIGVNPTVSRELIPGSAINNYVIGKKLTSGPTGDFYLGQGKIQKTQVIIKVLDKKIAESGNFSKYFIQKSLNARHLVHPEIMRVLECGDFQGMPYLIAEFVPGEDLRQILQKESKLDWKSTLILSLMILESLDFGHSKGAVHGHLKPENIILKPDGKVVLLDFGVPHAIELIAGNGPILDKPVYISPEHLTGALEPASDLYSLGVIIYELLTGAPPFVMDNLSALVDAHRRKAPIPPRGVNPNIPLPVENMVLKLLAKSPQDRYKSAGELLNNIRSFLESA